MCCNFSDFSFYHLFEASGGCVSEVEQRTLEDTLTKDSAIACHADSKNAIDFVAMLRKKDTQLKASQETQMSKI